MIDRQSTEPTPEPQLGERLPSFALPDLSGATISSFRFRGRLSLALFLAADNSEPKWLSTAADLEAELRTWGTEMVLVLAAPAAAAQEVAGRLGFEGITLIDADGAVHRRLGAATPDGRPYPALLIVDRVGELRYRLTPPDTSDASRAEAIGWVRYLGIQEPECGCCSVAEGWGEPD
jgi:peroxiredoxin